MPFVVRLPNDEYGVPQYLWATRGHGRKRYKSKDDINDATVWNRAQDAAAVVKLLKTKATVVEVDIVPAEYLTTLLNSLGITTVNAVRERL